MHEIKAIDIETIPNMAMVQYLPEPEAAGNIKDPEKIAADIAKKRVEQVGKMALSPMFGRICAYSIATANVYEADVMCAINDDEERRLIGRILGHLRLSHDDYPALVGWNCHAFDLPFIYKRALILGVELHGGIQPLSRMVRRYSRVPVCDLMQELATWDSQAKVSLDVAAKCILGKSKLDHDFSQFPAMIETNQGSKIAEYCLNDSKLTYELYQVCKTYLW